MRFPKHTALLLSLLLTAAAGAAEGFTAFENGGWKADIILPEKPNQAESFAAQELRYHLGEITGKTPEIRRENESSPLPHHFCIGFVKAAEAAGFSAAGLPPDGHRLRTSKGSLYLFGGDRDGRRVGDNWSLACQGTLYAVYDLLENEFGVRWIWPGKSGEVIPARKKIVIGSIDRGGTEPLVSRRFRIPPALPKRMIGWSRIENRTRFLEDQRLFLIRHRFGSSVNTLYSHNFANYWKRFGKTHPEFFSLLPDGRRGPLKGDADGSFVTLCVSQPELWRQIVRDWRKDPRRKTMPWLNACENDTPGMCTCPECRAWDAPDPRFAASPYWSKGDDPLTRRGRFLRLASVDWGESGVVTERETPPSLSDRYAKFYMALLREAKKSDPAAKVVGYAYANYAEGPRQTRLDADVVISFVPATGLYRRESSRAFRENWLRWRNAGVKDMILRPNHMLCGGVFPLNFGRRIAEDFAFAAANGMIGTNYDSLTGVWGAHNVMLYTLIRIHREPGLGYDKVREEFCSAFAPAEKEIGAYLDYWENFSDSLSRSRITELGNRNKDRTGDTSGSFRNFVMISADLYTEEELDRAARLLAAARERAAGSETALKRIAFLEHGLQNAVLTRRCREAQKKYQQEKTPEAKEGFLRAFREMCGFRASVEAEGICDFEYHAALENQYAGWPHRFVRTENAK